MKPIFAWIGDQVASREARDRGELAGRLDRGLRRLAETWPDDWLAPPIAVRGVDEISGVLRRPEHAFDAAVLLNRELSPATFRVAVAAGTLDVLGEDAAAMDGPAFHAAADTLKRCEEQGLLFAVDLPAFPTPTSGLVESLARLHGVLAEDRLPSQLRTASLYRELGTQAAVAEALGITQQAVSKSLRSSHEADLAAAEDALRAALLAYPEAVAEAPS